MNILFALQYIYSFFLITSEFQEQRNLLAERVTTSASSLKLNYWLLLERFEQVKITM
jgi:hypothetical protein